MRRLSRPSLVVRCSSLALALALAACGQSPDARRIEGRWKSENFRFQGLGLPIGPDLHISRDRISLINPAAEGLDVLKLTGIAAQGSEVTLHTEIGIDIVFAFENDDRMYFSVPFTQSRIHYQRLPAVARVEPKPAMEAPVTPTTLPVAPPSTPVPTSVAVPRSVASTQAQSFEAHYEHAVNALRQGNDDIALRSLSTALEGGFSDWKRIDGQPLFDRLHDDMRFQVLRARWNKG